MRVRVPMISEPYPIILILYTYKREGAMSDDELSISGIGFLGESYVPENIEIIIKDNKIKEINATREDTGQYILPAFFNAHTHLGDTIALDTPIDRPLAELVAPPNGLKHRILRTISSENISRGISASMSYMFQSGTAGFADFREGGPDGVQILTAAQNPGLHIAIFGRDGGELLPSCCGFGLSSAHGYVEEEKAVEEARKLGKLVAVHSGEAENKDIESAFALNPDVIIHATQFETHDIMRARDEDVIITVCPRSNWLLNVTKSSEKPQIRKMLDAGVNLTLGTDNAMFVPSDMFSECAFLITVYKVSAEEALHMATDGFQLLGIKSGIEVGYPPNITVMDGSSLCQWTKHPLATLLTRIGSKGVKRVISSKNFKIGNIK